MTIGMTSTVGTHESAWPASSGLTDTNVAENELKAAAHTAAHKWAINAAPVSGRTNNNV